VSDTPGADKLEPSSRQRLGAFRKKQREQRTKAASASAVDPRQQRRRYLRQYRLWLWPYRAGIASVFGLALVGMGLEMVLPMATRAIIDDVLLEPALPRGEKLRLLNLVAGGVLLTLLLQQVVEAYRQWVAAANNSKIIFALRKKLFDRLVELPLATLQDLKTGGIVSRLSSDVDNVTGLVQMAFISPGVAVAKVLLTLAILLGINWQLAVAAAAMLPPLVWLSVVWVKKVRPVYRSMADDRSGVDARVAETFGGIRVVRSFLREPKERLDYAVGHHTIIRKRMAAELVEIAVEFGWSFIIPLVSLVIVWFGGFLYLAGATTIGDLVAFQMYAAMLLFPVWRIIMSLSQTQRALASMEKVFEIFEKPLDLPDVSGAVPAPTKVESLKLEHLGFEYKQGLPVLHDVSLSVRGGFTVALVGPSGAGKTTLTDLIARFFDPTTGRILVNGIDIRRIRLAEYRKLLGVVQQEVFLFDGTVRENIAYGRRDAPLDAVVAAAERANVHGFVSELPQGYDTLIGERGVKLSGGQRQRLSIARAILADPEILILDEATSNLDSESEQQIQAALRELFKQRTTFVIAHRLSTITHADLIVAIDKGRVVETGSHAELMARGGFYAAMVERQRASFTI
jgi:ATP-binding cassette subfamily B protein/subfamily B ATP-binding cassette protein MsbA